MNLDKLIAEARDLVTRQKGLIIRLERAGASTSSAQRVLVLLEKNLRRLESYAALLPFTSFPPEV